MDIFIETHIAHESLSHCYLSCTKHDWNEKNENNGERESEMNDKKQNIVHNYSTGRASRPIRLSIHNNFTDKWQYKQLNHIHWICVCAYAFLPLLFALFVFTFVSFSSSSSSSACGLCTNKCRIGYLFMNSYAPFTLCIIVHKPISRLTLQTYTRTQRQTERGRVFR